MKVVRADLFKTTTRMLLLLALTIALAVGGVAAWRSFMPANSGLPVLRLGGDFALTDSHRQPFTLQSQRGRLVLLSFGFTHCPDVCPLTLARYRALLAELSPADAARLQPLLVTVDPRRDTPDVLDRYVRYFDPRILGLTGTPDAVAQVQKQYGVIALPERGGLFAHSDYLYLIDDLGRLRRLHDQQATVAMLAADVRALLREARGR